jgi:hypothetical protein
MFWIQLNKPLKRLYFCKFYTFYQPSFNFLCLRNLSLSLETVVENIFYPSLLLVSSTTTPQKNMSSCWIDDLDIYMAWWRRSQQATDSYNDVEVAPSAVTPGAVTPGRAALGSAAPETVALDIATAPGARAVAPGACVVAPDSVVPSNHISLKSCPMQTMQFDKSNYVTVYIKSAHI